MFHKLTPSSNVCTLSIYPSIYEIYLSNWDRKKKTFFLVIRLRLFFFVVTAMHFVQANVAIYAFFFFFNISVRLFFNKMLKNYGFAMPLASEPRPYMAIFAHIWP